MLLASHPTWCKILANPSWRTRTNYDLRDDNTIRVINVPLLRTRRRHAGPRLVGKQGAAERMGGLSRGYQTVILEGGAGTGSVIVLPGAETVMIVKAPPSSISRYTNWVRSAPASLPTG